MVELQEIHNAEQSAGARDTAFHQGGGKRRCSGRICIGGWKPARSSVEELDPAPSKCSDRDPGRKKNVAVEGLLDDLRTRIQEMAAAVRRGMRC